MSAEIEASVADAINETRAASVIRIDAKSNIHALCRHHRGCKVMWCNMLEYVLVRKSGWDDHFCQQYFIRNGKLVFGWNIIITPQEGETLESAALDFVSLMREAARIIPDVMRAQSVASGGGRIEAFPLVGASPRRTAQNIVFDPRMPGPDRGGPSHKGAYTVKDNS